MSKREFRRLRLHILPSVLSADERDGKSDFNRLSLTCLVGEVSAYVVSGNLPSILRVDFIPAGVLVPLRLGSHRALMLPPAGLLWCFGHTEGKVDRIDRLGNIVAEVPQQLHPLDLSRALSPKESPRLIRQPFTEIEQQVTLPGGEGEATHSGP